MKSHRYRGSDTSFNQLLEPVEALMYGAREGAPARTLISHRIRASGTTRSSKLSNCNPVRAGGREWTSAALQPATCVISRTHLSQLRRPLAVPGVPLLLLSKSFDGTNSNLLKASRWDHTLLAEQRRTRVTPIPTAIRPTDLREQVRRLEREGACAGAASSSGTRRVRMAPEIAHCAHSCHLARADQQQLKPEVKLRTRAHREAPVGRVWATSTTRRVT